MNESLKQNSFIQDPKSWNSQKIVPLLYDKDLDFTHHLLAYFKVPIISGCLKVKEEIENIISISYFFYLSLWPARK